jgi:FtsP/CotA-like multicopper oxidase with cupredoxin domain
MLNQNEQDGANGVTECPIPPMTSKTYAFKITQYGTTWYHSHFTAQYGNGIVGSIQINGPASADYDIDLGPYVISDWYHQTADVLQRKAELVSNGAPPTSDNILFNGSNINPLGAGGEYNKVKLTPGKKHRLRLINTSVDNGLVVSMVGHDFTVIQTDFVPVKPIKKSSLFMAVGQRYDVIIEANKDVGNYWFNATVPKGCGTTKNTFAASIFTYKGAKDELPRDAGVAQNYTCADTLGFEPVLPRHVPAEEFEAGKKELPITLDKPVIGGEQFFRWRVNGSDINVEWEKPILEYIAEKNFSWPGRANVIDINKPHAWTFWVVQNTGPVPHPIHLHGHDFSYLGAGSGTFSSSNSTSLLNFNNPIRRDVAILPADGWLVIAFKTDNPGAWLMHCHIAWHVSMGLSVQFLERKDEIRDVIKLDELKPTCDAWRKYQPNAIWPKNDSGL